MDEPQWQFRAVDTVSDLESVPPTMTAAEAQDWCNFVVFAPRQLPAGTAIAATTLRKEAPPGRLTGIDAGRTPWSDVNPAALRTEIAGGGRRLRIKQFLYDWAFPALDHPALWRSDTWARRLSDHDVMWFGVDYMDHAAASARLERTMIELSVLEGEFSDDELHQLYSGLTPVSTEARRRIRDTPFSALNYWARHPRATLMPVPIGLWTFQRAKTDDLGQWSNSTVEAVDIARSKGLPTTLTEFEVDSVALFSSPRGDTTEVVYTSAHRSRELRLIVGASGADHGVVGEPERHPARLRFTHTVDGVDIAVAGIDPEVGPFDAVWSHGGRDWKLLSSTAVGMDREWFTSALTTLARYLPRGGTDRARSVPPLSAGRAIRPASRRCHEVEAGLVIPCARSGPVRSLPECGTWFRE